MGEALGIRYQNPVMSEEEALEILKTSPVGIRHPADVWA
jgi:alkaline phosphatase